MVEWLTSTYPTYFSFDAPETRVLCRVNASTARVDAYDYDRRSTLQCSQNAAFRAGDTFTVIAFLGDHAGAHFPPMLSDTDIYPMHAVWHVSYSVSPPLSNVAKLAVPCFLATTSTFYTMSDTPALEGGQPRCDQQADLVPDFKVCSLEREFGDAILA